MPIRIERQRTAVRQDMAPERPQIGARRFARREVQRRQPPRRIVDEHDQRATRAAPLEPIMRAGVDLDQLAEARTPLAQLKHPLMTPPLRFPNPELDLKPSNRLARDRDPFQFRQLLSRQRRAEIPVLVQKKAFHPRRHARIQTTIRRPPSLTRN